MPPKKQAKKKTAAGYKFPEHLDEGTVLTDLAKRQWTLGPSIGVGGFGEIYLVGEGNSIPAKATAKYVVKIEPKENGPLFVEMHFYMQVGKPDQVKAWGKPVNMPQLRGHGSYQHKSDVYRFLVIDRFGCDLDKTFENGRNPLSMTTAATLAVQTINTLEYIHSRGYTHNDVKAANMLLGLGKDSGNVYLVDFGLCVKYITQEQHKEYKPDPRKAHDGTIEYLSRDAHIGCTSRRSDLEVLCFNLIHWTTGKLPWLHLINSPPTKVQAEKDKFMSNLQSNVAHLDKSIQKFILYVNDLDFQEKPDYEKCRGFFNLEYKKSGGKVDLSAATTKPSSPRKSAGGVSPKKSAGKATPVKLSSARKAAGAKPVNKRTKKTAAANGHSSENESAGDVTPASNGRRKRSMTSSDSDADMFEPTPPKKATARSVGRNTPRSGVAKAATPRSSAAKAATPRSSAKPANNSSKKKTPKYKEIACQTSPGFVNKANIMKKAQKILDSKKAKRKETESMSEGEPDMSNLTPAMREVMKRKQLKEAEKASKKKKST